ncbi:MAG: GNAT family N-acetyltransferase [Gammaproteobacteria bacterium]|nr:GNAT family N-acetyltransferase [Gammaproteobacteria bacterium]
MPSLIEGRRFILRRVTAEDAALLFSWLQKPAFVYYQPTLARLCPSVPDLARRIAALSSIHPPVEITALVLHRASGAPIGVVELSGIDRINGKAEFSLGFVRGRGTRCLAETISTVLDEAFRSFQLHKLIFYVVEENRAMLQFIQRCNLHKEGFFKEELIGQNDKRSDLHRFALFAEEWRQNSLRRRLQKILAI